MTRLLAGAAGLIGSTPSSVCPYRQANGHAMNISANSASTTLEQPAR